ncbi:MULTISPECIES: DUF58 domain-containing protein [unclassified Micromonospora]|uniref:DUF58 domain-containing protein n=1 Tax=unclassified Micromonospora TaxID=2617518 RepID=UPI00112CD973|nr:MULTISPECIES: DUF58 domain-containing protein [unclassified Micromonospora]MCK1806201.1 DUF58 domain-containing protein [Micromonospora sp. R42106]MCK1830323.1 DUF58 domain-containing protein [Micromonospora sp. R42003]MCK1843319.1 DUF58 domain-containing protein [Micromonospora sp. R42004]MCM1015739.1 DUF58 domain-containing protein [Micromonospora sp. XM-20-01]
MTWRAGLLLGVGALTLPFWPAPFVGMAVLTVVVLLLVALDRAMAAPPHALTVTRSGDRTVRLGGTATVTLHLTNPTHHTLYAQVRDAWVPSAGARLDVPPQRLLTVPPGGTATLPVRLTPTRRGDRPAVALTVRSLGPMRLGARQRAGQPATPPWTLRVLPRFDSRRHLPEKLARLRVIDGVQVTRGRGHGTEFDTLREYAVGDDVRSIDWRGSARRADILVRTWRPERDRRLVCVLDTGRTSAVRLGDEPRLDTAIDAALLLTALAARAGDRVDLLAADTEIRARVTGSGRPALLARLVEAVAPLEPTLAETDFELIAGEVLRRERQRSLVVLFTALEAGAIGEGLLPVLPRLATRHRVVLAAGSDPVLSRLATATPTGPDDPYAAASAWRALAERDRVRAALSRYGVTVVDVPAHRLAPAVADTYLRLKSLGQL